ncbi:hypothetical protein A2U01_0083070, partial [Trifolium medium]|nr:hypothetical protein [Trifolium medium]
ETCLKSGPGAGRSFMSRRAQCFGQMGLLHLKPVRVTAVWQVDQSIVE